MGFQGASLAAHQREIKVEDDERGQEERRLQIHLANDKPAQRAAGRERGPWLGRERVMIMQRIILTRTKH